MRSAISICAHTCGTGIKAVTKYLTENMYTYTRLTNKAATRGVTIVHAFICTRDCFSRHPETALRIREMRLAVDLSDPRAAEQIL